jgi:uncharacterized membrane protein
MKNLIRFLTITITTGTVYMGIELLYRQKTHWTMMIVAGLTVYLIGLLDENKRIQLKIYQQSLIGMIIATTFEFLSGIILNKILELNIWSYQNQWGNIWGQICPLFSFFWFLISVIGIWLDNYLRHKLFNEEKCDSLFKYYLRLFTLK